MLLLYGQQHGAERGRGAAAVMPSVRLRSQLIGLLRAEAPSGRFAAGAAAASEPPQQRHSAAGDGCASSTRPSSESEEAAAISTVAAAAAATSTAAAQLLGFGIVVINSSLAGAGRGLALARDGSGVARGAAVSIYPRA